jgi:hypothetical protein
MNKFERIKKECFWDYDISVEDIKKIFHEGTRQEKKKLFEKIMYISSDKLGDLMLFTKDELKEFFKDFVPSYNVKYVKKHCDVLKYLLLDEQELIEELVWKEK